MKKLRQLLFGKTEAEKWQDLKDSLNPKTDLEQRISNWAKGRLTKSAPYISIDASSKCGPNKLIL